MIKGTCTPDDLVNASWVHLRPRPVIAVAGGLVLVLFFWALWMAFTREPPPDPAWLPWSMVGIATYLALMFGVGIPWRCRRTWRQRKDLQRACWFVASSAGLRSASESVQADKPWSDFLKWKEGRHVFLLYMSDHMYQAIPKRFFSSQDELVAFREFVSAGVARRVA